MKQLCIVIPARNEQNRIGRTLEHYAAYFKNIDATHNYTTELLVVNNASTDNTVAVVTSFMQQFPAIRLLNLDKAGKGLAIVAGFKDALLRDHDYIGFVDADMATSPEYFYELVSTMHGYDGVIASRYMPGAHVYPPRPWIKYWGRKLVYDALVRLLFGLPYHDFQCGAKIFSREVIQAVAHECTIKQWAFDVELLYLAKKHGFSVKEIPTVWHDQADSKLHVMRSGLRMLSAIIKLRMQHSPMQFMIKAQDL